VIKETPSLRELSSPHTCDLDFVRRNPNSWRWESWEPSEAEGCSQELAALVEHGLFDHLVRPQQQ
jgi:hypothetical protein